MSREEFKPKLAEIRAEAKKKREAEGRPLKPLLPPATTPLAEPANSELRRLAALPPMEYDRVRQSEAKKLNCRVSTLDAQVAALRSSGVNGQLQGRKLELPEVEPWPTQVNGAEVLCQIAETLKRYIVLSDEAADATALWCAHAHAFQAFQCTPRLDGTSPDKGCGKTTLRDVIACFVPRPLLAENMSVAVLFRAIEQVKPTILVDECDGWIRENPELLHILNSGHRRGGQAWRCEGDNNDVRGFNVFAPVALFGIGSLPGTLHDRSIIIRLERARPGELKARFDSRHVEKETELCRKIARFCADNMVALERLNPKLPAYAFNRLADNWRPLFAIAEIAGGEWPQRATAAFIKLTAKTDIDAESVGTKLLTDIRQIFEITGAALTSITSADLVKSLHDLEDSEWLEYGRIQKPISKSQLARLLRLFGIAPRLIRTSSHVARGYVVADFKEVFARYLVATPELNLV